MTADMMELNMNELELIQGGTDAADHFAGMAAGAIAGGIVGQETLVDTAKTVFNKIRNLF